MQILIKDIPQEGLGLSFSTVKDPWFRTVVKDALAETFQPEDETKGEVFCFRTRRNVDITGKVHCLCRPICSRCGSSFQNALDIPIHLLLAPFAESEKETALEPKDEAQWLKDDLEFSFYERDSFNLGELIREQIILALPQQPLCRPDCKGLCSHCGMDLNREICRCTPPPSEKRWEMLRTFKPRR